MADTRYESFNQRKHFRKILFYNVGGSRFSMLAAVLANFFFFSFQVALTVGFFVIFVTISNTYKTVQLLNSCYSHSNVFFCLFFTSFGALIPVLTDEQSLTLWLLFFFCRQTHDYVFFFSHPAMSIYTLLILRYTYDASHARYAICISLYFIF